MARRAGRPVHGWVVLDKPEGPTSARAVARVRTLLGAAKAGHAGTLDPIATGVLPVALGEATKTVGFVMDGRKAYRFTVRWGEARDTGDAAGACVAESPVRPARAAILAALPAFRGPLLQVPPAFSAIKVGGIRAYRLARRAEPVVLAPREVEVYAFELLDAGPDSAEFEVHCGKGTYIRSLVRDLAERLGAFGYVAALRRTRVGPFGEKQAISLDKLGSLVHSCAPEKYLLPVEAALVDIPALPLTELQAERLRHGQAVRVSQVPEGTVCATAAGRPVALAEIADGEARVLRVFNF
jgi:tRNA pseudouridine55 synthase